MSCRVEGHVGTPLGSARFVRSAFAGPIDRSGIPERHRIELSLLPLSPAACAGFPEEWGPHRFERIGEVCLYPARRAIRAKSDCRVQDSVVCSFLPEAVQPWLGDDLAWVGDRLERSLDIANPQVRALLARVGRELRCPGFGGEALVELMMGQVAIELARHLRSHGSERGSGGLAAWRLRLIDERLADGAGGPAIGELARLCGLSVRQLARGFRASRGCSLGTAIAAARINRAKWLLAQDQAIKQIAHAVGFASASQFAVAFRRATGEAPREYRGRHCRGGGAP